MSTIKIYDIQGRLLYDKKQVNASQMICDLSASTGVLLVQISNTEGVVVTKKVMFSKIGF
jgi:hypothetical protein